MSVILFLFPRIILVFQYLSHHIKNFHAEPRWARASISNYTNRMRDASAGGARGSLGRVAVVIVGATLARRSTGDALILSCNTLLAQRCSAGARILAGGTWCTRSGAGGVGKLTDWTLHTRSGASAAGETTKRACFARNHTGAALILAGSASMAVVVARRRIGVAAGRR